MRSSPRRNCSLPVAPIGYDDILLVRSEEYVVGYHYTVSVRFEDYIFGIPFPRTGALREYIVGILFELISPYSVRGFLVESAPTYLEFVQSVLVLFDCTPAQSTSVIGYGDILPVRSEETPSLWLQWPCAL